MKTHDLEWIDVVAQRRQDVTDLPSGFGYHSGYRDKGGVQHWMFCREAPLSPGRCNRCPLEVVN